MADARHDAETETIFRDVNETIVEQAPPQPGEQVSVLCECSNVFCPDDISIQRAEYERIRADAERFIVRPEHVTPTIEVVVERHPQFWVIEKVGEARDIAEATDPRS